MNVYMDQTQPKTIFIVEDDVTYADILESVLIKAGFVVKVFHNPTNLLNTIKSAKPDLVILDIMLPQISGFTILEELKRDPTTKDICVFCLTNLPEEVGKDKALALNAYCYLTKAHYNASQILEQIKYYFSESKGTPPPPAPGNTTS